MKHRHGKAQKSLQGKYQASSNGLAAVCDVTAALQKLRAARPTAQSAPENLLTGPKSVRKDSFQKDSSLFEHSAGKDAHQRTRYVWQNVTFFCPSSCFRLIFAMCSCLL